jgi:hypothetical protein
MKKEVKLLKQKAIHSLQLAIERFNSLSDIGRADSVLMLLDHAFEMLLKAAIVHRGGRIHERGAKQTIGFDACVRRALSTEGLAFLSEDQALVLQSINGLRDAAQHYLVDVSENHLYMQTQAGVTLFDDVLQGVFDDRLAGHLPARALPVSTVPPTDLTALFESEADNIAELLRPHRRRRTEARARMRPLAILDATLRGEKTQPGNTQLDRLGEKLRQCESWEHVFPGAAAVQLVATGFGPELSLRLTKKEGTPVRLVQEGTPEASVVGVKRVNELDFYNLGAKKIAEHLGITVPKTLAAVEYFALQEDEEYFKEIVVGSTRHRRYSKKALDRLRSELEVHSIDGIWQEVKEIRRRRRGYG